MGDLDSTQALLDSTIPTPTIVDSIAQDSKEDEISFETVTDKEAQKGKTFKKEHSIPFKLPALLSHREIHHSFNRRDPV